MNERISREEKNTSSSSDFVVLCLRPICRHRRGSHSKRLNSDSETISPRPASILVAPYVFQEGLLDRIDLTLRLSVVHCYSTTFASTLFRGTNATRPQRYQGVPQVLRSQQFRRPALDCVAGIVRVKTRAMSGWQCAKCVRDAWFVW